MARSIILVSFFTSGIYAERLAANHVGRGSQAVAHASEFFPGPGQSLSAFRSIAMPGASVVMSSARVGNAPHFDSHGGVGRLSLSHRQSPGISMAVHGDAQSPGYWPDLPHGWKSATDPLGFPDNGDRSPSYWKDGPNDLEAQEAKLRRRIQLPREDWPEGQEKFYRFIRNNDPTFEEYAFNSVLGYVDKTPDKFLGTRKDGAYKGSSRVLFTLPGEDRDPNLLRTLELLKSDKKDNPSFGAVQVKLPLGMAIAQRDIDSQGRVVVTKVKEGSVAEDARLRRGDIIRAVSVPEPDGTQKPWWEKVLQSEAPVPEDGMAMLDAKGVSDFEAALKENERASRNAVLLIERPVNVPPEDDDNFWKGLAYPAMRGDPALQGVMIPIPVEKDPDPRYPPIPGGKDGPLPPQGWPKDISTDIFNMTTSGDLFASAQANESRDPVARDETEKKRNKQNEYKLNKGQALDTLNRDILQILRDEDDSRRVAPTNWDIYTDSLETDFKTLDPIAQRMLGAAAPSWSWNIKGKSSNQRVLEELRTFCHKFVDQKHVTAKLRMGADPSTGDEVIEARWTATLIMKRFQIPKWLLSLSRVLFQIPDDVTPEATVVVDAVSRFHLNAEGKIDRHSIDNLDLLVDQMRVSLPQLDYWLGMLAGSQGQLARPIPSNLQGQLA